MILKLQKHLWGKGFNNVLSHQNIKRIPALKTLFLLIIGSFLTGSVWGQTIYYSQSSSDPTVTTNWNTIRTGGGTSPANFTTNNQHFVIQNGHLITTNSVWAISGGSGVLLKIENGGTLISNSSISITSTPTFQIENGGTYIHNNNTNSIFGGIESFAPLSNIEIRNWVSTSTSMVTGISLPFGNLNINWSTNIGDWQWSLPIGNVNLCAGNFTISSTGTGSLRFTGSEIGRAHV